MYISIGPSCSDGKYKFKRLLIFPLTCILGALKGQPTRSTESESKSAHRSNSRTSWTETIPSERSSMHLQPRR